MATQKFLGSFVALLLFVATAGATEFVVPAQKIVGGELPVPLGELVILGISPIENKPEHYTTSSYKWKVLDQHGFEKRILETPDGIHLGSGVKPSTIIVICSATHLYIVKDASNKITQIATRSVLILTKVSIGDPAPNPNPNPNPDPNPKPIPPPVFPDGKYKLSKATYDMVIAKVAQSPNQIKGAAALATSFKTISTQIAAGALKDPTDILNKTKLSNQKALNDTQIPLSVWANFFVEIQEAIYPMWESGLINNADDFRQAWAEISAGLEAVK